MPLELEDRLERLADTLPAPTSDARDRARGAALAALVAAPRRRRGRIVLLAPAVAVAVAAVVAVAALLGAPWRDSPLATERALAALGHQPVIHAIVEQPFPRESLIDLASGAERREAHRSEYWYDEERNALRVRLLVGSKVPPGGEYLQTPEGFFTDRGVRREGVRSPRLDPALEWFARGYREALDRGEATVVGEEVIDGRDAVILRFPLPAGPSGEEWSEEVAVDADGYRPLRFRFSSAAVERTVPWSEAPRVVEIETISRNPHDFERPRAAEPRPTGQTGVDERKLEPVEAADALGQPALWPGRSVEGVELTKIELVRVTTTWTDGRVSEDHALSFQYGADRRRAVEGKPSLIVSEGTSAAGTPRYDFGLPPGPGELSLTGVGKTASGDAEMWFGRMQREGVYVAFESPQRDLILAAAQAMTRLD